MTAHQGERIVDRNKQLVGHQGSELAIHHDLRYEKHGDVWTGLHREVHKTAHLQLGAVNQRDARMGDDLGHHLGCNSREDPGQVCVQTLRNAHRH